MKFYISFAMYFGFALELISFMGSGFAISSGNFLTAGVLLLIGLIIAFIVGKLIKIESILKLEKKHARDQ